jgi:hypothetical protein
VAHGRFARSPGEHRCRQERTSGALRAKTGKDMSFVLSVERPVVAVSSAPWLDDEFWLEQEDDDVSLNSNSRDV